MDFPSRITFPVPSSARLTSLKPVRGETNEAGYDKLKPAQPERRRLWPDQRGLRTSRLPRQPATAPAGCSSAGLCCGPTGLEPAVLSLLPYPGSSPRQATKRRRSSTRKKKKTLITAPLKASYTLASYPSAKLYEGKAPLHHYFLFKDPIPSFILAKFLLYFIKAYFYS